MKRASLGARARRLLAQHVVVYVDLLAYGARGSHVGPALHDGRDIRRREAAEARVVEAGASATHLGERVGVLGDEVRKHPRVDVAIESTQKAFALGASGVHDELPRPFHLLARAHVPARHEPSAATKLAPRMWEAREGGEGGEGGALAPIRHAWEGHGVPRPGRRSGSCT